MCLDLLAPAKVNLFLSVRGRRPDGYHDLRMFLAPVSLFDRLRIERLSEAGRVEVACEGDAGVPSGEENLCARAARFYFAETGVPGGARISVRKAIPSGAGLGGGSSDAAVTILGLERLFGCDLSGPARERTAFRVGADVPFFFVRTAAWVEGIGEVVTPAPEFAPLWLVLVHPGTFLSTREVFSRWASLGLTTPGRPHTIAQFNFRGFTAALRNDLADAAQALAPAIRRALVALREAGAPGSLMSGSGSAVFGLFPDELAARRAASSVRSRTEAASWRVDVVRTLPPDAFPFLDGRSDWGVDKR